MLDLRDPVSSSSHLLTAAWAVFATLLMLRMTQQGEWRRLSVLVYGATMVLLFLASGTFHGLHYSSPEQMRFFQKVDQSFVYMLIAGTNTPMMVILLRGRMRQWLLALVWLCAFIGVASLWLLPKAPHPFVVSTYVVLGWLGTIPLYHYYRCVGLSAMNWIWLGAFLYTLGAICELTGWPVIVPGVVQAHEVLHICDSAACVAFFIFIMRYVIPYRHPAEVQLGEQLTEEFEPAISEQRRLPISVRSGIIQR